MFRSWFRLSALAILLIVSVIAPVGAGAVTAPVISVLGQISDGLKAPSRVAVDGAGNLYVADIRAGGVLKYDRYGRKVLSVLNAAFTGAGLAVTADGATLYVAGSDRVFVVSARTGAEVGLLGAGNGELGQVGELDLDADGYLYVADTARLKVAVYDPAGLLQYTFGGPPAVAGGTPTDGQFRTISALTVNAQSREVLVADSGEPNVRLQVFGLDGTFIRKLTATTGFGAPTLYTFGGSAVDTLGRLYVLDFLRGEIRILNPSAEAYTYLSKYAQPGTAAGQLTMPADVAFDASSGRLFVANGSGRVEVFGVDGAVNPLRKNNAPGQPVSLSPASEVATAQPVLTWANAVDADSGDVLTYNVKLSRAGAADILYNGIAQGAGDSSSLQLTGALVENSSYSWSVQAFDGTDLSAFSESQSFVVNAVQEAPTAPALIAPTAAALVDGSATFSWSGAVDPDPADSVRYVVQVSATADFATPVIETVGTSLSADIADLAGYADLVDGNSYFWRVQALDNHDLATASATGTFVYDTAVLKITANMPDARVFLGGSHGYSGREVGTAPLELRDLPAGVQSVVVERSGFEPWVGQVTVTDRGNVTVNALLVPAVVPAALKSQPLKAGVAKINCGADAVPVAVDFDNDGSIDLLTGEADGKITLYRGVVAANQPAFAAGELLLTAPAGAAPAVVDWNNDGKKDLLVGTGAGAVVLYLNSGSENAPVFGAESLLSAAGAPLNVGATAFPTVIDVDGDGDKDLVVGSASGTIYKYLNIGSDAAVVLAAPVALLTLSGDAAPTFVDWDGDGVRELLVAVNKQIAVYEPQADGTFVASGVLAKFSSNVVVRQRIFAYDADGKKGKDLLVGNAGGDVQFVRANGSAFVPALAPALLDKVAEIEALATEGGVALSPSLQTVKKTLLAGNMTVAKMAIGVFGKTWTGSVEVDALIAELVQLPL